MKELLLVGTTIFALVSGSASVANVHSVTQQTQTHVRGSHTSVALLNKAELKAQAQAEMLHEMQLQANADKIQAAIRKLKKHVGKTWYVFSGATPRGWDCSGLTMWFYEQLDITIEHRASKQIAAGTITRSPKPGDIVVFTYKGSKSAYHVGIYIDEDAMIHAPKHGHVTSVQSISSFGGDYSKIQYVNILETL